jgi:hypothetical protein
LATRQPIGHIFLPAVCWSELEKPHFDCAKSSCEEDINSTITWWVSSSRRKALSPPWSMLQPSDRDGGLIFLRQLQSCLDLTTSVWNWWKTSEVYLIQKHLETSSGKPKSRTKNEQRHLHCSEWHNRQEVFRVLPYVCSADIAGPNVVILLLYCEKKKTQSLEYEAGDDDGDASHTLRPFLTMLLPRSTPIYPDLSRLDGICDDLLIQFSALLDEVLPEQALCAVTPVGAHWALRIASCSFIFISAARLTLMRLLQGSMQFLIPGGACVDVCWPCKNDPIREHDNEATHG